jgi:mono/diheme cytochrome c family protein
MSIIICFQWIAFTLGWSAILFPVFFLLIEGNDKLTEGQLFMSVRLVSFFTGALFMIAAASVWAQNPAEGKKLYDSYCSTCHGEKGKGDGAAARALPVKPADHTNGAIMNQLSDQFLIDIISKGGSAVGKSSFMPSWGGAIDDKQIGSLVAYLRSIADPPYKSGKSGSK